MKFIRFAAAASACVILSVVTASTAFAVDGWQKNAEEKWIYYEADQPVKNKWLEQDGHWMRTNSKGEMVRNTSAVVDGKHYAFDTNGYLLKGAGSLCSRTGRILRSPRGLSGTTRTMTASF